MTNIISFEEYCEDFIDQHIGLMSDEQLKDAKAGYADFVRTREKTPAEKAKHEKALKKAKESRKLAKFYGGKALTGTAKQKKWAEEIRQNVLESADLSDEQKTTLVTLGGYTSTAKFWINNKDKKASAFKPEIIIAENTMLNELYEKHYNTLIRSNYVSELERARKEIYEALCSLTLAVTFEFPRCDFYDAFGNLNKGMKFRC